MKAVVLEMGSVLGVTCRRRTWVPVSPWRHAVSVFLSPSGIQIQRRGLIVLPRTAFPFRSPTKHSARFADLVLP